MITISPNTSVSEWGSVSFSLLTLTSGSSAVDTSSYQWQFNGEDIVDATGSTLTISEVLASDSGDYTLTWTGSDGGGEVGYSSSAASHLVVNPVVVIQPTSLHILEGEPAGFTASFSSSIPVSQTWYRNGSVIAGETNEELSIAAGQWLPQVVGNYYSVGTTASGSAQSNGADLSVFPIGGIGPTQEVWVPYNGGYYQKM